MIEQLLLAMYGGSASLCAVIGLVFLRYWKTQRERLFVFFAMAFWCFTIGWSIRITTLVDDHGALVFVPRLIGFLLIIVGIVDKNQRAKSSS